jgi:hypothetical protein
VLVPYLLEQVLRAEERGPGAQQRLEDPEFLNRQVELPPVAGDRAPQRVELDPGRPQGPGLSPWAGFGVLCGYTALALGLAVFLLRRRDA